VSASEQALFSVRQHVFVILPADRIKDLLAEANEITAIMVASRKTASS
jgi:hypothetical protein